MESSEREVRTTREVSIKNGALMKFIEREVRTTRKVSIKTEH